MRRRRSIRYSPAELTFVESRKAMRRRALHAAFVERFGRADVTADDLKALCTRRGWSTNRTRWTPEHDALLRALYPDTPTAAVAERVGHTLTSTYQRALKLGLGKSEAYLASPAAGRTNGRQGMGTRFPKGHAPANKGKTMPFHPNSAATRFKPGERRGVAVKLYKPIGSERMSKEGYLERKIHDGMPLQSRWRAVHLLRWEAIHGPKPKGMVLKNLDGDRLNTDPSNWELIPRAMLPRLSGIYGRGYDDAPAELKPVILAVTKLEHAANAGTTAADRRKRRRTAAPKPSLQQVHRERF